MVIFPARATKKAAPRFRSALIDSRTSSAFHPLIYRSGSNFGSRSHHPGTKSPRFPTRSFISPFPHHLTQLPTSCVCGRWWRTENFIAFPNTLHYRWAINIIHTQVQASLVKTNCCVHCSFAASFSLWLVENGMVSNYKWDFKETKSEKVEQAFVCGFNLDNSFLWDKKTNL